jgi:predicted SAM-dependent methyltransferase
MKLNLGCAKDIKEGYINVDLHYKHPNVINEDISNLSFVKNSEAIEIYAKDILEHLPFSVSIKCLEKWYKYLKPDGRLYIQTTNFIKIIEAYNSGVWNLFYLNYMLFSGVNWIDSEAKEADFHKSVYSKDSLLNELGRIGYKIISVEEDEIDDALKANPSDHNLNIKIWAAK